MPNKIAARRSVFSEEQNRQSSRHHMRAEICSEQTPPDPRGNNLCSAWAAGKMKVGINQKWQAVQDPAITFHVCVYSGFHQAIVQL